MVRYILEVITFQAIFLAIYLIFFRRETFFNWNRLYLLATAATSFLLPFAEFTFFQNQVTLPQQWQQLAPVIIGESTEMVTTTPVTEFTLNWWLIVYAVGFVFSLGVLFRKYQEVNRYYRFRRKENQRWIIIPNSNAAFTFLNTIFIGEKIDTASRDYILAHEQVHVTQRHGVDLLFFEVLRVVFWFNPLVYAYQKILCEVHEYLADKEATRIITPKTYYNQLLNTAFGTQNISFTNTFFNHSLIKKRIIMLQKQSKTTARWKYLLLIPILAGMLTYVGCSSDNSPELDKNSSLEQQIEDLRATIDAKEHLSEKEKEELMDLVLTTVKDKKTKIEEINDELEKSDVPFAVIEEVPVFPGCEGLTDNAERKECMSENITAFVQKEFDTNLGKELELKGVNKVYVQFKVNEQGQVEFMGARGPHPALEREAERVVNLIPNMKAGKQKGQNVGVLYALPIVFQIEE